MLGQLVRFAHSTFQIKQGELELEVLIDFKKENTLFLFFKQDSHLE